MESLFAYTLTGVFTGAAYAIAASGLVLTYSTTRVFNIAHGAFGMVLAFVFWDFSVRQGLPSWLALILVVFVVAPAIGVAVQRFVARGLGEAPVGVGLVVTVGMLVMLIGFATQVWPPAVRAVPLFFGGSGFTLFGTFITWHQVLTVVLSGIVAAGLYVLLTRTRVGAAMRASVDNPELLKLYGGRPDVVAALAWAIGISLAALGGILLAPQIGLQYYDLTLLVINAYAAAMLGRLKSLPLAFAGAIGLGVLQSLAVGYLPSDGALLGINYGSLRAVIPTLFLFFVIVLMPQAPLRIGQVKGLVAPPVPTLARAGQVGGVVLLFVALLSIGLSESNLLLVGTAATYAIVMLSLVLLTGYGGHVSLAQFTFAGVGALAYAKLDMPNLLGVVLAAVVAAAVGALVALPVLRLTGLYLALSTLAFAQLMDKLVFQADWAFKFNGTLTAERMSVVGYQFTDTGGYVLLMVAFFVLTSIGLLALRKGSLGRLLIAMRDSQAACGTLGLNMRWFRVGLFAGSAGIAGMAGALFAGLRGTFGAADFQFFASLLLLLLAVVCGVTTMTGAAVGGVLLMLLPVVQSESPAIAGLVFVIVGGGAVVLGRDPNGLANRLFKVGRWIQRQIPEGTLGVPSLSLRRGKGNDDAETDPESADSAMALSDDTMVIEAVTDDVAPAR